METSDSNRQTAKKDLFYGALDSEISIGASKGFPNWDVCIITGIEWCFCWDKQGNP